MISGQIVIERQVDVGSETQKPVTEQELQSFNVKSGLPEEWTLSGLDLAVGDG